MSLKCEFEKISDGITFTSIVDKRLKTNTIGIHMITPLDKEKAAKNAIVPLILCDSNAYYHTFTELNKKLASLYGAGIRGAVSKKGDSQILSLSCSCIDDSYALENEEVTAELLDILVDCLVNPNIVDDGFEPKDFENKRQELLDDILAEINDKRSFAIKHAVMNIFENEPASVSPKGEIESVQKLTPQSAYKAYNELLKSAQIEVIYVGKSPAEFILQKFKNLFNNADRNFAGVNHSNISLPKNSVKKITEYYDVVQSKMVIGLKTNYSDQNAVKMFNAVFGATPFSKLFLNVREKLSLCYYCSSGYNDTKGVLYIDSGVEKENIEKAEKEIFCQLKSMQEGDFSEEMIENSRLAIVNSWKGVNDSPRSISEWYFNQRYNNTAISPEQQIELINKVTKNDIINVAKSMIPDTVYVLTNE